MVFYLTHQGQRISWELIRTQRKTVEIQIHPPGLVRVRAPKGCSEDQIARLVASKADWIGEKLKEVKERTPIRRPLVPGQPFLYLGREYQLKLLSDSNPQVSLAGEQLCISSPSFEPDYLRKLLEGWYRYEGQREIEERVAVFAPLVGKAPREIRVKEQKRRWGSCTSQGRLLFNWRCVMAPKAILDYIVVHEMCHLQQMNHSPRFWRLVGQILPDYQERRDWLREHGHRLNL
ncbi:MAG: M48 family metallopeptidase [Limnochordia bacterium]|jgi:predicted metal-dependent hydrolase